MVMTDEYIRKVVAETVLQIKRQDMWGDWKTLAYKEMSERLFTFYRSKSVNDPVLKDALGDIMYDQYFIIIPLFYRDNITLEAIAEDIKVDYTTIARNKKRLVLQLHLSCGEELFINNTLSKRDGE